MTEILITSSVLILALLLMRKLFRNSLSRRMQYALWGLVLLRLLLPVNFPAVDFSVLTAAKPVKQTVTQRITTQPIYIPVARAPLAEHPAASDTVPDRIETSASESVWVAQSEQTAVQYKRLSMQTMLTWIWLVGSGAAVVFLLAVNGRFWLWLRRVRKPWGVEDCALPVYLVETGLSSSCLFGLFRPAIYLTPAALASPERLRHVLAHETTHARHLDHLWTLLRGVCLAVYWFDPLVWVASAAAKTDCELACEEGTLARLEETDRIPYGQTLLSLIPVQQTVNPLLAATTMAAGKKQLKDRFTRIAQKPRQFAAATVVVALLAGVVSICTFTGVAASVESVSDESQEDAGLQALTGEELRYFNEMYFNGADAVDEYGYTVYNIRNQFANPMNLYEKPEDINLYDLFYCDGTTEFGDVELKSALDMERGDLPCPAYKLTTEDIDRVLTQYVGLTLEQTNKVGLEHFTYLPDYDAYYWAHGDTNYPGDLSFIVGTRAGKTVTLYQNGWWCVTLEEQEDGGYRFVSNQACEKPTIPTPMPAWEPDAVIPLDVLEPYEAPAVTVEPRAGDFDGNYENLWDNWDFDGQNVVIYRATDGTVNAAIRNGDIMNVFLADIGDSCIGCFDDLFGRSGFTVTYYGQINENPRAFGTCVEYYFFAADGALELLARSREPFGESPRLDLNGDGSDELISELDLIFQRDDGKLYRADIYHMVLDACPEMDYLDYCTLDRYSKCLSISGLGYSDVGRNIFRWLYFDGEQLLLFKQEKSHHDHMVDGIDQYVPEAVVSAAREFVEREVIVAQPDGTWRHTGYQDEGYPQETYDDWRIESFRHEGIEAIGDATVDMWTFNYELHTITPENVVLAGGKYLTEDDWVSPGYPGCDWLFFRVERDAITFLWHGMINDMSPGSPAFQEYLQDCLALIDEVPSTEGVQE